jgi:hypothetical protein
VLPSVVVSGENLARQTGWQAHHRDDTHEVEPSASHSGKSKAKWGMDVPDEALHTEEKDIQRSFDNIFDQALVFHGFAEHMRDYDMFVYCTADARTGIPSEALRYRFVHCVYAAVESSVPKNVWQASLDDRLIDYDTGVDLDGYVWGVKWQMLYPGAKLVSSDRAAEWSSALGIPFHEALIETNAHNLRLVFQRSRWK